MSKLLLQFTVLSKWVMATQGGSDAHTKYGSGKNSFVVCIPTIFSECSEPWVTALGTKGFSWETRAAEVQSLPLLLDLPPSSLALAHLYSSPLCALSSG